MEKCILYYSKKYGRVRSRNSYTVSYYGGVGEEKFGQILYFFVSPRTSILPLVVVKVLEPCTATLQHHFNITRSTVNHLKSTIVPVQESGNDITELDKIQKKCLCIDLHGELSDKYVVIFPHKIHN